MGVANRCLSGDSNLKYNLKMPSTLTAGSAASRCVALPILLLGTISIGFAQSQPLQYSQNPAYQAILHDARAKWKEANEFEETGNVVPAAIRLQNATRLAAQVPRAELTNGELLFIAQLQTAYARIRYQAITVQPNEQTWSAYLQSADDAKTAIDTAGYAIATGQPAASALMLRGQIELMNCNYEIAIAMAQHAGSIYPGGKKEYTQFAAFAENAQKNGTGPCASNRAARSTQWKQYAKELYEVFEVLEKVQTVARAFE